MERLSCNVLSGWVFVLCNYHFLQECLRAINLSDMIVHITGTNNDLTCQALARVLINDSKYSLPSTRETNADSV